MSSAGQQLVAGRIPGERIATAVETTDSTGTATTEIQVMSVVAPLVTGRTYGINLWGNVASTSLGDIVDLAVYRTTLGSNRVQFARVEVKTSGPGGFANLYGEFTAAATANETFIVGISRTASGTGTVHLEALDTRPAFLYVDYISG